MIINASYNFKHARLIPIKSILKILHLINSLVFLFFLFKEKKTGYLLQRLLTEIFLSRVEN